MSLESYCASLEFTFHNKLENTCCVQIGTFIFNICRNLILQIICIQKINEADACPLVSIASNKPRITMCLGFQLAPKTYINLENI